MYLKRWLYQSTKRPPLKFALVALCTCSLFWSFHRLVLTPGEFIEGALLRVNLSWLIATHNLPPPEICTWGTFSSKPLPPTYSRYHQYERDLSTYNHHANPEAKYLLVGNHVWRLGFGNVMQDYVLHSVLTLSAGRTPVFDNYTWSYDKRHEYTRFKWSSSLIPSRIPLTAVFSGPIAGSPLPSSNGPSAITRDFFEEVCQGHKFQFDLATLKSRIDPYDSTDGKTLFEAWVAELSTIDEKCVEVNGSQPQLFNYLLFGSERLHSLSETYFNSEILKYFSFSPLIHDAFNRNMKLFLPPSYMINNPPSTIVAQLPNPFDSKTGCPLDLGYMDESDQSTSGFNPPYPPEPWNETFSLPGLLALHIRRGDFEHHCSHLAKWSSDFQGFSTLLTDTYERKSGGQVHPDNFVPLGPGKGKGNTPENNEVYRRACFPTIEEIVRKVKQINEERRRQGHITKLSTIYIMTNGTPAWLAQLKDALLDAHEHNDALQVHTSRDLDLTHDQKYVSHAFDMYIGARAEVFVGNGFSSLTSNVVMLRMARGVDALDTRFW